MARSPIPGGDPNTWGDILNNYLLVAHNADGSLKIEDLVLSKYTKPPLGIPRSDLSSEVQNALDVAVSGGAPDATTTSRGIVRLSGDLTGDALNPLVAAGRITGGTGGHIQSGTISNVNIHANAAISKSKLAPLNINNGDIVVGAAIAQSKIADLTTDLASKANISHAHTASDITSGVFEIARIPTGTTAATVALGSHGHAIEDINNLQTALNAKANTSDLAGYATTSDLSSGLSSKANTSDLDNYVTATDLDNGLAIKANTSDLSDYATTSALSSGLSGKANTAHTHTASEISDFISATTAVLGDRIIAGTNVVLDFDPGAGTLTINSAGGGEGTPSDSVLSVASKTGHVLLAATDIASGVFVPGRIPDLNASKITAGLFDIDRIPTGTTSSTVALGNHNHDSQYAAVSHQHTISQIENLQDTLDSKASTSALSGYATTTDLNNGLASKQNVGDYATNTSLSDGLDSKADESHVHQADDITSGTLNIDRIPTGTTSSTVALGNHTHIGQYATASHNHNDLYYTESEVDAFLSNKLNASEVGAPNGVARLDADGKILASELPALAVKDTFTVESEVAMLGLAAQKGDMAIRTDNSQTYVLAGSDPAVISNWAALTTGATAGSGVVSYLELEDLPTLGTAAAADTTDFATAAQGDLATSALQSAAIEDFETTTQLNSRDTANRNRSNHTGEQAISTVTNLQGELDSKVSSTTVGTIWTGTQAQYDLIGSHDTNTLYLITGV